MQFDSFIFLVFFVIVFALYWSLRSIRAQNAVIVIASLLFYGWWDWRFLSLLFFSAGVDFFVARRIATTDEHARRKRLLIVSICSNLGILASFKYFDFFTDSFVRLANTLGFGVSPVMLDVILPVGISFYTFQSLSYTIDVYRGKVQAEQSALTFAAFVAFFPQLMAGPIERASRMLPQFKAPRSLTMDLWRTGITLIIVGLVKKVAIADNMAPFVNWVFGLEPGEATAPLVFAGSLAFAVQIYADFSGYTDMARGLGRLLGFDMMLNFDKPYVSRTPSEFWRRWHISLSTWLRDYLYVPLGGNRGSALLTYRNLMLTMVLGGLWHGAAWNFVIWGAFHGLLLCVYRALRIDERLSRAGWLGSAVALPIFFAFTLYGWMLFRAQSLAQVAEFTAVLFQPWSDWALALPMLGAVAYFSIPIAIHHWLSARKAGEKWMPSRALAWRFGLAALLLFGVIHARASGQAFIYFQF